MTTFDSRSADVSTDDLLDAAFPATLLVAAASWLPAGVLLVGYAVRVVRAALSGTDELPPLDDVSALAWTGLRASVVVVAYQLPVVLCLGAVSALWYVVDHGRFYGDAAGFARSDPIGFARFTVVSPENSALVVAGLVVTGVVALLASYTGTVALVAFAATDRLDAAFDRDTILAGVRSVRFRRQFVLASVVGSIGVVVAGLVALVPLVGPFVGAFVELIALVGALRVVADGSDERLAAQLSSSGRVAPVPGPEPERPSDATA